MEAGTLVEWLKRPGDALKRGDIIAVVDTQKGAIEIEVFEDGVLERTVVEPGQEVPVGTVLAIIRGSGAEAVPPRPDAAAAAEGSMAGAAPAAEPAPSTHEVPAPGGGPPRPPRASPAARKLAADLGLDVGQLVGTGADGAITREDVQRAAASRTPAPAAPAPGPSHADRTGAMRAAIAAAMARSKREIPHYYLSTTIDLSRALAWVSAANQRRAITERLLPAALLVKAVALGLREVPELNGFWRDDAFEKGAGIHVGVAISLRGGGLVAPAIHDADRLELTALMTQLQDVVARARSGTLRSSELADPTVTVTNLGEQGVESAFGIIHPPQVALIGFGRIAERPIVVDGVVLARPLVTATLSGDHRATDGHRGGLLLAAIDRWLQTPEKL